MRAAARRGKFFYTLLLNEKKNTACATKMSASGASKNPNNFPKCCILVAGWPVARKKNLLPLARARTPNTNPSACALK